MRTQVEASLPRLEVAPLLRAIGWLLIGNILVVLYPEAPMCAALSFHTGILPFVPPLPCLHFVGAIQTASTYAAVGCVCAHKIVPFVARTNGYLNLQMEKASRIAMAVLSPEGTTGLKMLSKLNVVAHRAGRKTHHLIVALITAAALCITLAMGSVSHAFVSYIRHAELHAGYLWAALSFGLSALRVFLCSKHVRGVVPAVTEQLLEDRIAAVTEHEKRIREEMKRAK